MFQKRNLHELKLPTNIILLALFGLFLGLSSAMVYSQLVLFLKSEFNTSNSAVAFLDGLVEFISYLTRIFSGVISDILRNKKTILLIGCFLTFLTKPLLFLAHSYWTVFFAQSIDRVSNGIQASPRDALIAQTAEANKISQSYGFTRSLKTIGSFLGSSLAFLLVSKCDLQFRDVFLIASAFALVAFFILFLIKYQENKPAKTQSSVDTATTQVDLQTAKISDNTEKTPKSTITKKSLITLSYIKFLSKEYWYMLLLAFIYEMGHFADSLLHIRASAFMPLNQASKAHLLITIGQILSAYPMGLLSDRFNKKLFIKICFLTMICANLTLLFIDSASGVMIASLMWGVQLGATQGLFLSVIADLVPTDYIATAIGIFYFTVGSAYFAASNIAGILWDKLGHEYTFMYSICIVIIAFLAIPFLYPKNVK